MEEVKTITHFEKEQVDVDLSFLYLENKINEYWTSKGRPTLLRVRDLTDDVVMIGFKSPPPCAIFIRSTRTLIRTEDKGMRWAKTKRAFLELIPNIKILE